MKAICCPVWSVGGVELIRFNLVDWKAARDHEFLLPANDPDAAGQVPLRVVAGKVFIKWADCSVCR